MNEVDIFSEEFHQKFTEEKKERLTVYPDIETYLRIKFGIQDIMKYEADYSQVTKVIIDDK